MNREEQLKQMHAEKWESWQTRANMALRGTGGQLSIFNFLRTDGIDDFTAREISGYLFDVANKKQQTRSLPKKILASILILIGGLFILVTFQTGVIILWLLGFGLGGPMIAVGLMMLNSKVEQKRIF